MKKFSKYSQYFVYILQCQDGTYYTGYTNNLENRIKEHNNSKRGAKYTRYKRPVKLVWCKEYRYFKKAFLEEKRIKKLRRYQKEEIISGKRKSEDRKRRDYAKS